MPRSTFQSEKSFPMLLLPPDPWKMLAKLYPFVTARPMGTGKKEGAYIHEVEVLTGLKPGKLPVEVVAVEREILATQRDLSSGSLLYLLYGIPPHRQACREVHRSFRDLL